MNNLDQLMMQVQVLVQMQKGRPDEKARDVSPQKSTNKEKGAAENCKVGKQ